MSEAERPIKLLFVGVGGQGVLTAARMLGRACLRTGLDVTVGQLHGMSQRGGSVEAPVLLGPARSSYVEIADVVIGFEPLEALRALPKMGQRTLALVNLTPVVPAPLALSGESYPPLEGILEQIRAVVASAIEIPGAELMRDRGARSLNMLMLGGLEALGVLPFAAGLLKEIVESSSPPRFRESNARAFQAGQDYVAHQ